MKMDLINPASKVNVDLTQTAAMNLPGHNSSKSIFSSVLPMSYLPTDTSRYSNEGN